MAELNALVIDEVTGAISIPVGATGWFILQLSTDVTLNPDADRAVFGVGTRKGTASLYSYTQVFRRDYPIELDADNKYYVRVYLSNAETRVLTPGSYFWDITLVTDPVIGEDGKVVVDDTTDQVYPIYAVAGALPSFTIIGGVLIV